MTVVVYPMHMSGTQRVLSEAQDFATHLWISEVDRIRTPRMHAYIYPIIRSTVIASINVLIREAFQGITDSDSTTSLIGCPLRTIYRAISNE